ncbi:MAG: hypothetical protein ACK4WH_04900 [Phycisphaerales bacterium]
MTATTAAAPDPRTVSAAGSISRAEIVRLGQSGPPWAFIPAALRALEIRPSDHEIRFLLAAAFARLLLVTPAKHHLSMVPSGLECDGGVRALGSALAMLPDDRIPIDELARTCGANVRAVVDANPRCARLAGLVEEWRHGAGAWQWLRSRDGNIVRRRVSEDGVSERWIGLQDVKGRVDGLKLPHTQAAPGSITPPYIIEGMDPPWLAARVLRETPAAPDGYQASVTIVQEDPVELLDGLAQLDLAPLLAPGRVRVIVGPGAGEELLSTLMHRLDTQLLGPGLSMSTVRTRLSPGIEASLQQALRKQAHEQQSLLARVDRVYAGRDAAWWAERFARALGGGDPLRVLIPTCRYSTYIKHAAADLAAAFERIGHKACVLVEPDDHSHLSGVAYLRAIAELEPDMVVMINYARANINGLPGGPASKSIQTIHPNIPFVVWVQDAMPHQLDPRVGASMGALDFVVGNLREEYFRQFGYPRARSLDAPIVASAAKFHPGEPSPTLRERHGCEVAYVSHHAETPEAMHERKRREAAANPGLVSLIDRLRPAIGPIAGTPIGEPISSRLRALIIGELRRTGGDHWNETLINQLLHTYAMPMADRMLRHETLAWVAEIAERRGWRLHIHGRGWERHPTLAPYARGELDHGEGLRASYHCARVHLQVSAHTVIHQRIVECALSGGLPVGRIHEDDLSTLAHAAAVAAASRAIAEGRSHDACDPWTVIGDGYRKFGYATAGCAETMAFSALRQRLGLHAEELVWINSSAVERLQSGRPTTPLARERSLWWYFDDPADHLAVTREGLEAILTRAVENPEWREARVSALRDRLVSTLTHEAFATRLCGFVAETLGQGKA